MNRIIKFRAWDKDEEKMDYDVAIVGNRILFEYDIDAMDSNIEASCYVDIDEENEKYFELMQYTGLKDKNDKEIYEGDIIEEVYPGGKSIKGKIIYNKDAFEIEWISKNHFNNNILHVRNKDIQVIGNIFEDSNLLQQKE